MDIQALLSILLVILYFILQAAGRNKKGRQQRPVPAPQRTPFPQHTSDPDDGMDEWERALREIRTALGDVEPEPEPPRPTPVPRPVPQQHERPPSAPKTAPAAKHTPIPRAEDSFESPHFEEWRSENFFERRAPVKKPAQVVPVSPSVPVPAPPVRKNTPAPSRQRSPVLEALNEPETARNAIILGEILGPPRARNPRW